MTQLEARELINNGWFITCLCLVGLFAIFLLREMRENGWYRHVRNQAAIALMIYFAGEAVARGWAALLLYGINKKGFNIADVWDIEEKFPIAMLGSFVSFVGALCCVRVFSPPEWGNRGWLAVAIAASVFCAVTYVY